MKITYLKVTAYQFNSYVRLYDVNNYMMPTAKLIT